MTSPFELARDELSKLRITLRQAPGEYRVSWLGSPTGADYATDSLEDALQRGRLMAQTVSRAVSQAMGPLGKKSSRYGKMIRHNRKVLENRRSKGVGSEDVSG